MLEVTKSTRRRPIAALALGLAVAIAMVLAACGGGSDGGTTSSASDGTTSSDSGGGNEVLNVGYTPGLTGELGPFDSEVLKGIRLRVKELNAEGGADGKWTIKLDVQEGASDPAKQRVATQELLEKGADFLIGSCSAAVSTPSAILASSKGVPMVLTCAGESTFPQSVGEFAFLANSGTLAMGGALAQFAAEDEGWKKAYIVGSDDIEYTTELTRGFKDSYERVGGEVVAEETVDLFQQSYQSTVDKIAGSGVDYDVIMTPLFVPDAVAFLKELRAAGVDAPVLLGDGADTPLLFSAGSPGAVYVASFGFPEEGSNFAEFAKVYEGEYGGPPQSANPGLGADIVDLIAAAAAASQSTDPGALRDAFAELEGIDATTTEISYKGAPYGQGLQNHPLTIVTSNEAGDAFAYAATVEPDPEIVDKP